MRIICGPVDKRPVLLSGASCNSPNLQCDAAPSPKPDCSCYAPIVFVSALTLKFVTVGHFTLPVAGLFIKIESQSRRASDLFKT